jgi:hypothetical protein
VPFVTNHMVSKLLQPERKLAAVDALLQRGSGLLVAEGRWTLHISIDCFAQSSFSNLNSIRIVRVRNAVCVNDQNIVGEKGDGLRSALALRKQPNDRGPCRKPQAW